MDLDRLNIHQARQLSKVIDLLGTPASADEILSCITVCEACATLYKQEMQVVAEANRRHGDA
jgi:hypothetical protein